MTTNDVVACASSGCPSRGKPSGALDLSTGKWMPEPPAGWGEIAALGTDGTDLVLWVCSQACQRRLARKLTTPTLGTLDP